MKFSKEYSDIQRKRPSNSTQKCGFTYLWHIGVFLKKGHFSTKFCCGFLLFQLISVVFRGCFLVHTATLNRDQLSFIDITINEENRIRGTKMNYTSLQDYEHFLDKDSLSRVCIGKVSIVWFNIVLNWLFDTFSEPANHEPMLKSRLLKLLFNHFCVLFFTFSIFSRRKCSCFPNEHCRVVCPNSDTLS